MQSITIQGSKRESVGKKATKALRNADKVPCVIYGGEQPIHFSVDTKSMKPLVYTPKVYTAMIELNSGEKINAIVQDLQFHPVSDALLHVDFYQLNETKLVTMNIPVTLEGTAVGIKNGGTLLFPSRKLSITCLPKDLPDFIKVDITPLNIGDKIYVKDIKVENVIFNHPENSVVCQVRISRATIEVTEDEEEGEEGEEGAEGAESGAAGTDKPETKES